VIGADRAVITSDAARPAVLSVAPEGATQTTSLPIRSFPADFGSSRRSGSISAPNAAKGIELTPELGATLAERGGAWMADQVSQALEHAAGGAAAEARRCSPKAS
jgi:hypothetical protein